MAYTQTSEWTRSFLAAIAVAICVIVFGISTVAAQDTCHSASRVKELRYVGVEEKLKPVRDCWLRKVKSGEKNLSGAYLADADLSGSDLQGVDLSNANLNNANLSGANLGLNYGKKMAESPKATNLTNATLRNAVLDSADFNRAILVGADLTGATIRETTFKDAKVSTETRAPNRNTDWTRLGATVVD